ncbi:MAG: hypothetical protein LBQ79_10470 [Deltaproteobacteria bacterium]|jgi:hypothetical protein|nr:hypothetical protein [Deltaproteobacteria bacterium]
MKSALKLAACAALALGLAACGDARLDTTDANAFAASIQKMYDSTKGTAREDFQKYFFIAMNGRSDLITMSVLNGGEIAGLAAFFNAMREKKRPEDLAALNGLTAGEVVELGRGLKITYLEGRLQELRRDIDQLRDTAGFYSGYLEQLDRVTVTAVSVAEPSAGGEGRTGTAKLTVTVRNGSDLELIGLQRPGGVTPWTAEISLGESRLNVPVASGDFTGPDGAPAFPVAPGQEKSLTLVADVAPADWPFPPEIPLGAAFPEGIEACLKGYEKVPGARDTFLRMQVVERHHARLTQELSDTKI